MFRVQNNTGHKLISGFPEGRRMWVNIRTCRGTALREEINPYDDKAGTLRGLPSSPNSPPLGPNEKHLDRLVYEMKPGRDLTGEKTTFHFVLATARHKDNRIPPRGFDTQKAAARLCEPVWEGTVDPVYSTAAEYAGGYDEADLTGSSGAGRVAVTLHYQGTSGEYVEILRDAINGTGKTLPPAAYIVQTDPFFSRLKAWGTAIWDLWFHNHGLDANGPKVPGIVPVAMAHGETGPTGPRLRHTGSATPGGAIQVEMQGTPSARVVWSVSLAPKVFDPPILLPGIHGGFYLRWPFVLVPVGAIPPGGVANFPLSIPASVPVPSVIPAQALVGLDLTSLDVITVAR